MAHIEDALLWSLAQQGDRYIFGYEIAPGTKNPPAADCSELVEWSCGMAGIRPKMPDGSWIQYRHCRDHGTLIPVSQAIRTRGALLFRFGSSPDTGGRPSSAHVAWSLGDGTTIEARGTKWGVGVFSAHGRGWTHAGLVPGADYSPRSLLPPEADVTPEQDKIIRDIRDAVTRGGIGDPNQSRLYDVVIGRTGDLANSINAVRAGLAAIGRQVDSIDVDVQVDASEAAAKIADVLKQSLPSAVLDGLAARLKS